MHGSDGDGEDIGRPGHSGAGVRGSGIPRVPPARPATRDAGFTFLELLISLTILLLSIVAITGLMVTSAYMTTTARQKSAMVSAAAGYLERVRQEAFANVGTPGGDPDGTLVPVTTTTGPYTITVTPSVTWGRPEDPTNRAFKTVTVSVVALGGPDRPGAYESSAVIGQDGTVVPQPSQEATPAVAVVAPPGGSAVWGSSASVTVSATANSATRTLASIGLYDGASVVGLVVASGQTASHTFGWNTSGVREGLHVLSPTMTDSQGRTTTGPTIDLLVDNLAPGPALSPSIAMPDGSSAKVWWVASQDGTGADGSTPMPTDHYMTAVRQQPSSAAQAADYTQWTAIPSLSYSVVTVPTPSVPLSYTGLTGFSRFVFTVEASSPDRGTATGLLSAPVVMTGITRPTLNGTWTATKSGGKYSVQVVLGIPSGPTFPWSGTATTRFYRLTSSTQAATSGTLVATISSSNSSWAGVAATDTRPETSQPTAYWYVAVTTLTPQGYGAGSATIQSSVIGPPANMTGSGPQGMVFTRW